MSNQVTCDACQTADDEIRHAFTSYQEADT